MSPPDGGNTLTLNDAHAEEDRMRASLGLAPEHAQAARPTGATARPVRDGEVPVAAVGARRSFEAADNVRARLATLDAALKTERGERAAVQQALVDAQRLIQQLQTKLAHAEMAAAEALQTERTARLAAEAKLVDLAPASEPAPAPARRPEPIAETVVRKRGRPPGKRPPVVELPEPEPVQWWLPSYSASKAKRAGPKS